MIGFGLLIYSYLQEYFNKKKGFCIQKENIFIFLLSIHGHKKSFIFKPVQSNNQ